MDLRNGQITVGEVLQNPRARALLQQEFPGILSNPMLMRARNMPLGTVAGYARRFMPQQNINQMIGRLRAV